MIALFCHVRPSGSDPQGCRIGSKAFLSTRTRPDPRAGRVKARIRTRTRPIGQPKYSTVQYCTRTVRYTNEPEVDAMRDSTCDSAALSVTKTRLHPARIEDFPMRGALPTTLLVPFPLLHLTAASSQPSQSSFIPSLALNTHTPLLVQRLPVR